MKNKIKTKIMECYKKERWYLLLYCVTLIMFKFLPLCLSKIHEDIVFVETCGLFMNILIGVAFLTYLEMKDKHPSTKIILFTVTLLVSISLLLFGIPFGAVKGGIFLESGGFVLVQILEWIGMKKKQQ